MLELGARAWRCPSLELSPSVLTLTSSNVASKLINTRGKEEVISPPICWYFKFWHFFLICKLFTFQSPQVDALCLGEIKDWMSLLYCTKTQNPQGHFFSRAFEIFFCFLPRFIFWYSHVNAKKNKIMFQQQQMKVFIIFYFTHIFQDEHRLGLPNLFLPLLSIYKWSGIRLNDESLVPTYDIWIWGYLPFFLFCFVFLPVNLQKLPLVLLYEHTLLCVY